MRRRTGAEATADSSRDRRCPAASAAGWWLGLSALLALLAVCGRSLSPNAIDWQPQLAASQPWRAWSAVAVHYSSLHLGANLAGTALVAALGGVARPSGAAVLAWAAAWPLTQFGLLVEPALRHYGGLSGVLHAGVAVAAVQLVALGRGAPRAVGGALLAGLAVKVVGEAPWGPPLRQAAGWDIAVAPLAHASGALAGLVCGLAAVGFGRPAGR